MSLSAFMVKNSQVEEVVERVISTRFKDEKGQVVPFKLRRLTSREDLALKKESMITKKSRRGAETELDQDLYVLKRLARSVVSPDLKSEELQNYYGVRGEVEALLSLLSVQSEMANLIEAVNDINSTEKDLEELVEEAKN